MKKELKNFKIISLQTVCIGWLFLWLGMGSCVPPVPEGSATTILADLEQELDIRLENAIEQMDINIHILSSIVKEEEHPKDLEWAVDTLKIVQGQRKELFNTLDAIEKGNKHGRDPVSYCMSKDLAANGGSGNGKAFLLERLIRRFGNNLSLSYNAALMEPEKFGHTPDYFFIKSFYLYRPTSSQLYLKLLPDLNSYPKTVKQKL